MSNLQIWQTARFVLIQLQRQDLIQSVSNTHHQPLEFQWISHVGELNRENKLRLFDVWIIHKLHRLIRLINLTWTDPEDKDTDDSDYRRIQEKSTADDGSLKWSFHHGVKGIQNWWMNDLCSTYLEVVKSGGVTPSNTNSLHVLYLCLMTGIHLLHPIMPHLTEVLWHGLRISTECKDNEFYIPENCLLMQTFPNTDWFEFLHQKPNVSLEVVEATMSELTMIATNINSWRPLLRFIDHVESSKNKGVESNDLYLMKIFKHRDDNGNNTSTISEDESSVLKALTCINVKSDMSKKKNDDNNLSHNYVLHTCPR
ncbi:unnamed protein product [Heterobilharzia americana]|nr:unnamed protein product [Heterobilharzia americana]